ncbi:hypothetical protein [Algoriphagus taiwanensis]|uniref:Toxin ETX/toxin MTX2 n=1 Tax=Algoriphagus taiwanensis TaxID=1445656 RepID=A0ABQ6Q3L9_9BACT|nr:hypothetical protein Ataiwa_30470 [Algoriphagus taiwanensis]
MKNSNSFTSYLIGISLLFAFSCTDPVEPDTTPGTIQEGQGISESDLETYEGEVGLVLNLRELARKGWKPTEAEFELQTSGEVLRKAVPVDEFGYLAVLKFPVKDLSPAQRTQLTNGVKITVNVKDQANEPILTKADLGTLSLLSNLTPIAINAASLPDTEEVSNYALLGGTGMYVQKVNNQGVPQTGAMRWNRDPFFGNTMTVSSNTTFSGNQPDFVFNFTPVPGQKNTFYIQLASSGEYLQIAETFYAKEPPVRIHFAPVNSGRKNLNGLSNSVLASFQFRIQKVGEGRFRLIDHRNRQIREAAGVGLTVNLSGAKEVLWRFVAKEIEWSAQPIATSVLEPVLPKATSGFSFNSTLTNCSGGQLQQTVGADFSEERTTTVGWAESISVNNTKTVSVSSTVGVTISAPFFGVRSSLSASVTTGFEWSHSVTSESSQYESQTTTKRESYFSSRVITVPPRSASLVYDAYQYYENVRVNHVQRIRISGKNERGRALTGAEIRTLFAFSNFNGVINSVEENSVVVTIMGFTILDKFMDTQSKVQEVPPRCN